MHFTSGYKQRAFLADFAKTKLDPFRLTLEGDVLVLFSFWCRNRLIAAPKRILHKEGSILVFNSVEFNSLSGKKTMQTILDRLKM